MTFDLGCFTQVSFAEMITDHSLVPNMGTLPVYALCGLTWTLPSKFDPPRRTQRKNMHKDRNMDCLMHELAYVKSGFISFLSLFVQMSIIRKSNRGETNGKFSSELLPLWKITSRRFSLFLNHALMYTLCELLCIFAR